MKIMRGSMITLEPMDIAKHAEGYFTVSKDEEIHRFTGNRAPKHISETTELLEKYEKYFLNWMIIANDTGEVIGIIRLSKPQMEDGVLVAGESQFLMSRYWRKGHMKEAKRLFYQYVFHELMVEKLYADVWEGNTNSIKSLEFYGYQLVEARTEFFLKTKEEKMKYIYFMHRNDYYKNRLRYE